jgi:glycine/D-amino acid oxidase-like deaminating enzyme
LWLSLNAAPALGEIERGVYAACCCDGLGTVKGTLYGKLITDLAAGSGDPMLEDGLAELTPEK